MKGEELRDHLEGKHTEGGVKCGECPLRLGTPIGLNMHKAAEHGGRCPTSAQCVGWGSDRLEP